MLRISGVSSYLGFGSSGSNCVENSTPKHKGMEIWLELAGVRVSQGPSYRGYTVLVLRSYLKPRCEFELCTL